MKNMIVRAASGAVYVALIVGCIIGGHWYFTTLMALFALIGLREFKKITSSYGNGMWPAKAATAYDAICAVSLIFSTSLPAYPTWLVFLIILCVLLYLPVRFTLSLYDPSPKAFRSAVMSVMSLAYIALPLTLLTLIYDDNHDMPWLVLAAFVMIWLNDTGAYLVGSRYGRTRLFERLSPKKSWEGFFGGLFFCIAASVICYYILPFLGYGVWQWIILGISICLLATLGDLFESLLKRTYGVKDSGNIIPGHGGILDRIDSLLFVSYGLFALTMLYR